MKCFSCMLVVSLLSVATGMKCPGSGAWLGHAKTQVTAVAKASCADVKAEILARTSGSSKWVDPHNGGIYSVLSSSDTDIETKRTTNPKKSVGGKVFTDKQVFTLSEVEGECSISACSESQGSSLKDFSTNYCDIRNLYCGTADGCTPVLHDFSSTQKSVDASSGQSDWSKCVVKPSPLLVTPRTVSWWFDVAENETVDAANAEYIRNHKKVFSRVMPYNGKAKLDGNLTEWWHPDMAASIKKWHDPLQAMNLAVLPYVVDTSNATQMHLVYANSTAFVADAIAIAEHYNFSGWFIDYEDETPADTDPNKSQKLAAFLTELGDALHAKGKQLTICVASWSKLLADYKTLAASSGVNELQLMSTYTNPGDYKSIIDSYFAQVKAGAGDLLKAGVGVGIYYDGHGGNKQEWTADSARAFVKYVADQGGMGIDVYRLLQESKAGSWWPRDPFWFDILSDFIDGKLGDRDIVV